MDCCPKCGQLGFSNEYFVSDAKRKALCVGLIPSALWVACTLCFLLISLDHRWDSMQLIQLATPITVATAFVGWMIGGLVLKLRISKKVTPAAHSNAMWSFTKSYLVLGAAIPEFLAQGIGVFCAYAVNQC